MATKKKKKRRPAKKKPADKSGVKKDKTKVVPYPTAGPKITEFEKILDDQLAGADGDKRGPGRPRKIPAGAIEPAGVPIDFVTGTIKIPFELWSISQDLKDLALTDKEARQLAAPAKMLLDYYMPDLPPVAFAWFSLGVYGFGMMRSRLMLIAEIKKQKQNSSPPSAKPAGQDGQKKGQGGPPVSDKFPQDTEIKTTSL